MTKNKSLDKRRDNRTVEEFAKQIKEWTHKENIWAKIIQFELKNQGNNVSLFDNGVDGDGKLIEKGNKNFKKLDKVLYINGTKVFVELKTCDMGKDFDYIPCLTFKTNCIRETIAQDGRMIVVDRDWWLIFRKDVLEIILKEIEPSIYYNFSPNDLAIRINKKDFQKYISKSKEENKAELRRWSNKTKEVIQRYEKDLFRKHK